MTKYPQSITACIEALCKDIHDDTMLAPRTERYYREQCRSVFNILLRHREDILPQNVTKQDILWLLHEMIDENYAVQTQKGYIQALRKITKFYNNYEIDKVKIRYAHDARPNVDWLTYEQAKLLMDCPKTSNQELIVNCELGMGFRRCEVYRLKTSDIGEGVINVIGKGPMGGKPRTVPFHPRTAGVIERYNEYRNTLIKAAQYQKKLPVSVPDSMMIYSRGGSIFPYSSQRMSGIDAQLNKLSDELGFHFTNHTLRRTFGRTMFHSGVPVPTISKLLGHESTDQTLEYIGINLDDMSSAMQLYTLR